MHATGSCRARTTVTTALRSRESRSKQLGESARRPPARLTLAGPRRSNAEAAWVVEGHQFGASVRAMSRRHSGDDRTTSAFNNRARLATRPPATTPHARSRTSRRRLRRLRAPSMPSRTRPRLRARSRALPIPRPGDVIAALSEMISHVPANRRSDLRAFACASR
jgi:hypothetical protein